MLPLKNRLKKKKDFENVFTKGMTARSKYFFLRVLENGSPDTRMGFVVSKKVSKKAVERNRIKRLFREAIRLDLAKIKPGYDLVFIVLNNAKDKEFEEIREEISTTFKKCHLI
jgi:ribonuclease P protein component